MELIPNIRVGMRWLKMTSSLSLLLLLLLLPSMACARRRLRSAISLSSSVSSSSGKLNNPMADIQRVLVFPPVPSWGQQAVQQRSLRMLIIGGNNSQSLHESTYGGQLQKWLLTNTLFNKKKNPSYIRTTPGAANSLQSRLVQDIRSELLGVSNELSAAATQTWPNIIIMEHGQDCYEEYPILCSYLIEKLLRVIQAEYEAQQLLPPDILFIDILRIEKYYYLGEDWFTRDLPESIKACQSRRRLTKDKEDEVLLSPLDKERAANYSNTLIPPATIDYNDRGSYYGMGLVELARFYRYPILTLKDTWYPAFVEHFLGHDLCTPWPYLDAGQYLTTLGHQTLFHLVQHFLEMTLDRHVAVVASNTVSKHSIEAMKYENNHIYNTDIRFASEDVTASYPHTNRMASKNISIDQDYFLPTTEEIDRALSLSRLTPTSWAENIVQTKSIRILLLGGSNTANYKYGQLLETKLLVNNALPYPWLNSNTSYILNGGISGHGPTITKLSFESELSPSQWPNVILMEYSVNCNSEWNCIYETKSVIRYYETLYQRHNISAPSFVFLELFRNGLYVLNAAETKAFSYLKQIKNTCDQYQIVKDHNLNTTAFVTLGSTYNYRGSAFGMQLLEFARYNSYPILSFTDALFPSFVRFMDNHLTCASWPLTSDGVHFDGLGLTIIVDVMLDFFRHNIDKALSRTHEDASLSTRHHSSGGAASSYLKLLQSHLPLFALSNFDSGDLLMQHRQWGTNIPYDEWLQHIIKRNQGFHATYLQHHDDGRHECYGSTETNATIELAVGVRNSYVVNYPESEKAKLRFKVMLGYLHSWNTSYVGDMKCRFYAMEEGKKLLFDTVIHGNTYHHQAVQDSTPKLIELTSHLTLGEHILQCSPVQTGRLACITSVSIFRLP